MSRYPQGQPVRLTTAVTDASGSPVDATVLTLTLKMPDGTSPSAFTPNGHPGTGSYYLDLGATDLNQLGKYQYKWVATGAGAGVSVGSFDVFDPFEPVVLSLQDAKLAANIKLSVTTYDDELAAMVATATTLMEQLTGGPIITRQVSEKGIDVTTVNSQLILKYRPAVAVVSITDWQGVSVDISDVVIQPQGNYLYRKLGLPFIGAGSVGPTPIRYDVVYTAGWGTSVPSAFLTAARIIVSHLWETQRGPALAPTIGGEDILPVAGMGYAVPYRALEVLTPYLLEAYV